MTYFYYRSNTMNNQTQINPEIIKKLKHVAQKSNWRITQLANGFYQTEHRDIDNEDVWYDVTRRETLDGAEAAIDGSIEHYNKKLEAAKGPKVVKTF